MNKNIFLKLKYYWLDFLILGIFFLVPIFFDYFRTSYNIFELNKQLIFRGLLTLLILYVLYQFWYGSLFLKLDYKIYFFVFIILFLFLMSSLLSLEPQKALLGDYFRQQGFMSFGYYFLWFILLAHYLTNIQRFKKVLIAINFSALLVGFYGLIQYYGWDNLPWAELASRIFSSVGQPNFLASYLAMVIILSLATRLFFYSKSRWRYLFDFIIIIEIFALLFTYSRSGYLGFLIGLIFLFIVYWRQIWNFMKKNWHLIVGTVVICLVILMLFSNVRQLFSSYCQRLISSFDFNEPTVNLRLQYLEISYQIFIKAPWYHKLLGFGPDNLHQQFATYYGPKMIKYEDINGYPDRAHNHFADSILQFGLLGYLVFVFLVFFIIIKSWRFYLQGPNSPAKSAIPFFIAALIAYFVNNLFSFSVIVPYVYFFACLAFLAALSCRLYSAHKLELKKFWRIALTLALGFFLVFNYIYHTVFFYLGDHQLLLMKKAMLNNDCRAVFDHADKMNRQYSGYTNFLDSYIIQYLNCLPAVNSEESKTAWLYNIKNALADQGEPGYYNTKLNQARAYGVIAKEFDPSYYQLSEKMLLENIKISPYLTYPYYDLARIYTWQKRYQEADEALFSIIKLLEDAWQQESWPFEFRLQSLRLEIAKFYSQLAEISLEQNLIDQAIDHYKKSLEVAPEINNNNKKIADLYYLKNDYQKALYYTIIGYQSAPEDPAWSLALAILYNQTGDNLRAKRFALKVLSLDPNNIEAKKLIDNIK